MTDEGDWYNYRYPYVYSCTSQSISREKSNMIQILFVCHISILKNPEKACKIIDFMVKRGAYYTATTLFLKEP